MTNVYTHNGPILHDRTSVHMIVSDAPISELGLSDDWYQVDAEEVRDHEELTDMEYAKLKGWELLSVERSSNLERIEKWGRL